MTAPDDSSHWSSTIDRKLKAIAQGASEKPAWYDAWSRLKPESSEEERLEVYRAIRDSDQLPDEAAFFLVSMQIDEITARDAAQNLREHEDRLEAIEEAYRFDEGTIWSPGTAPEGYEEQRREYHDAWDELFARKLEEYSEPEMARLFRSDREQFDHLADEGRKFFYGDEEVEEAAPVLWLRQLVEAVSDNVTANSPMGPLGYRYGQDEDCWEVSVYPTPVELIGGAVDGEVVVPGFSLDLKGLCDVFDTVEECVWQSLGLAPNDGPEIWVEGGFQGQHVFLQVLAHAPDDELPGMKLNVTRRGR
jgi:hypothetical protein